MACCDCFIASTMVVFLFSEVHLRPAGANAVEPPAARFVSRNRESGDGRPVLRVLPQKNGQRRHRNRPSSCHPNSCVVASVRCTETPAMRTPFALRLWDDVTARSVHSTQAEKPNAQHACVLQD